MKLTIRQETEQDYPEVYQLIKTAFSTAEHADGTEQDLVVRLRNSRAFIPELSLVAEQNGTLVGYILFTKACLPQTAALALAPLAVLPTSQQQGVGTALIKEGHRIAKALGYEISVVLGSEQYYPRMGYRPASEFGIVPPFEVSEKNFMAINLTAQALECHGTLEYDAAFFA